MLPTKNFKNQCLSLLFIAVIKLMINNLGREGLIWLKITAHKEVRPIILEVAIED